MIWEHINFHVKFSRLQSLQKNILLDKNPQNSYDKIAHTFHMNFSGIAAIAKNISVRKELCKNTWQGNTPMFM